jgi:NAD(P)-dependent dehydrogenase (short-subunit alcohol dehydrogenase family)
MIVNRPQMQAAYNASKAAVHQLTKSLAAEWAPFGVRVNALAPGYVKTEMAPVDLPEFRRHWIDDVPMQRYALPQELGPSLLVGETPRRRRAGWSAGIPLRSVLRAVSAGIVRCRRRFECVVLHGPSS